MRISCLSVFYTLCHSHTAQFAILCRIFVFIVFFFVVLFFFFFILFFFQAEDGIRDLVRSRGLGDVYKRQEIYWSVWSETGHYLVKGDSVTPPENNSEMVNPYSVSYTHLTLPTSDLV